MASFDMGAEVLNMSPLLTWPAIYPLSHLLGPRHLPFLVEKRKFYFQLSSNRNRKLQRLWFSHKCVFFCSPSRGRTRQLKADTVALAKTWHGAPHTAAEIFPGENPAPNTCKSLPPRQPSETKSQARYLGGKSCTQSVTFTFSLCNFLNPIEGV